MYKLLVYEEGCFFRKHRDDERMEGCFGTLVIQLPSIFKGDELTVWQPSDPIESDANSSTALTFSEQGARGRNQAHAFFFYADCYHELEDITSGCRVALVYTLNHNDAATVPNDRLLVPSSTPPQPVDGNVAEEIADVVKEWSTESPLLYYFADVKEEGQGLENPYKLAVYAHARYRARTPQTL